MSNLSIFLLICVFTFIVIYILGLTMDLKSDTKSKMFKNKRSNLIILGVLVLMFITNPSIITLDESTSHYLRSEVPVKVSYKFGNGIFHAFGDESKYNLLICRIHTLTSYGNSRDKVITIGILGQTFNFNTVD